MECSGCHAPNPPEARFCNQCGGRLERGGEAEHRQLTVVFADLVGSTQLAAALGPEDWRETVRRFQQAAGECVARFEGTVAQYLGDGVLVYFGYPIAHEDDPERALRAGLALLSRVAELDEELLREYGLRLQARVAAQTGAVVIGEMGGRMRTEQLALGEAPNVAARLQDLAPPGALVTSAATLSLVEGRFESEDLGEHALKGVREPVRVYRVVREARARSRFRFGAGGARSAFVGRAREVGLLRAEFEASANGRGRLVWITGEPGIGKSRLLHELQRALAGTPHRWLDLQASAYAQHSAFEPFRALLAAELGGDVEKARERLLADGIEVDAVAPAFEDLLGVKLVAGHPNTAPASPDRKRASTIASLCDWVLRLAEREPVVLAVEDLHAIDPSTVEVLERIAARAQHAPVLVAATARSGTKPPDGWGARATPLALEPLAPGDVQALIAGVANDSRLSRDLSAQVVKRSDGNPFFAEELVRAIVRGDAPGVLGGVPVSLRDPLRARLDATGPAQATAQLASALGREFSYALLRAVSKLDAAELASHLAQLCDAGLILASGEADARTYQFSHALLRDAAYDSMLRRTQRSRHADIARALKAEFGPLVRARPDLLAHHLAAAGEHAQALVEFRRAVKRASDACAFREVLSLFDRALALLEHLPESERAAPEMSLHIYRAHALGNLRGSSDPDAVSSYQRARQLAVALNDPLGACMALLGIHGAVLLTGSTREAQVVADELLERANQSGLEPLIKSAKQAAGLTAFARGDWPRANAHLGAALGLGMGWMAESHGLRAIWMCGERAKARALCDEYAERVRLEGSLARAEILSAIASTYLLMRDYRGALALSAEVEAIARRDEMGLYVSRALCTEGGARVGLGDVATGLERIEAGFALLRGTPSESILAWFSPFRADAHRAAGDLARAIALADAALAEEAKLERHVCEPELLRVKAEACAQLRDRQEEADALFAQAVHTARRQGARGWEIRAALSAARFLRDRGRVAEARNLLAPTVAAITEGHDQADPALASRFLRELSEGGR